MVRRRRGGVVLVENGLVAVIKRVNDRGTYYLFPGGGVENGETIEEAATREAREELGLDVGLVGLLAIVDFKQSEQYYYLATKTGGVFGTGKGEELQSLPNTPAGTFTPMWIPCEMLRDYNVRPAEIAQLLAEGLPGVPSNPLRIAEAL